jgi:ketosteroid isomerase-like protein
VKRRMLLLAAAPLVLAATSSWREQALTSAAPFIDKANEEWTHAVVTGDAEVMSAPYADEGIFVGPDGTEIRGRDAVRAMYARPRGDVKILNATIHSDGRAAHDPDDVYEWGTAVMTVQRGDKVTERSSRYLTVWHHSGERWLITHNIAF